MTQNSNTDQTPYGRFIVFEGVEGVGKSTQVQLLADWLSGQSVSLVQTREPGGTPLAENIRELVLAPRDEAVCAETELLLMMAARMQHWGRVIQPSLAKGQWVICDRFIDSSVAYQGAGRGLSQPLIRSLHQQVQPDMQPDLVILLDMPLEASIERLRKRADPKDRMEQASLDFFTQARASFLHRAQQNPERYFCVDATHSIEVIARQIRDRIQAQLLKPAQEPC